MLYCVLYLLKKCHGFIHTINAVDELYGKMLEIRTLFLVEYV